uniref:cytochrome P450 2C42-like isoform X2 n=1 Tax=Ciona intestinalis TaxID=7719 RepID=UPI00052153C1|nr:cytochrome P450 2C42-like isoform X2 [Ciona intestinalis]|eukprot:XP_002129611.2 cytochrome P450 2C42-like isoform X2 [Ciona intestinalis]
MSGCKINVCYSTRQNAWQKPASHNAYVFNIYLCVRGFQPNLTLNFNRRYQVRLGLMIFEIVITILGAVLLHWLFIALFNPWRYPPGPAGLPLIGSLHLAAPEFHIKLPKLAKKYGPIFTIKAGCRRVVFLVGYDVIKEVITDRAKDFASRCPTIVARIVRGEGLDGIAASPYGPKWMANRKFFYSAMRTMGLGKRGIEKCVVDEIPYIVGELENICSNDGLFEPSSVFDSAVLNVLAYFTFGNRYSYQDEKFKELIHINNDFFQKSKFLNQPQFFLLTLIPGLDKYWLPKCGKDIKESFGKINKFVKAEIKQHRQNLDPENPRDYIDCYLNELNQMNDQSELSELGLEMSIMDLFQAGTETTSTTLRWAILYLANNPHIQEKVQQEIDEVLGFDQLPQYEDRMRMPYCEATVLEVQRMATIAPIGLQHCSEDDQVLGGYRVPKRTSIVACYHSIHFDPKFWKNPNKFDPCNFLDSNGKVCIPDAFMPFGGGLRICVGMNIAKQELFLFFVAILQKFSLHLPDDMDHLDEKPGPGIILAPKIYRVQIKRRA